MVQPLVQEQHSLKNVNENELVISRVKQTHISGWKRPVKKKQ